MVSDRRHVPAVGEMEAAMREGSDQAPKLMEPAAPGEVV